MSGRVSAISALTSDETCRPTTQPTQGPNIRGQNAWRRRGGPTFLRGRVVGETSTGVASSLGRLEGWVLEGLSGHSRKGQGGHRQKQGHKTYEEIHA